MDENNSTEKVDVDPEFTPVVEEETESKKPVLIVGVVVFLIVITAVVFFLFHHPNKEQVTSYPTPSNKTVQPLSATDTKYWNTYQNKDFSIQYPPDTKMRFFDKYANFGFSHLKAFQIVRQPENQNDPAYFSIIISIVKNAQKQSDLDIARNDINALVKQNSPITQSDLVAYENNHIKGYAFSIPKKNTDGKVVTSGEHIIVAHDQSVLLIEIKGSAFSGLSDASLQRAEDILSTFSEVLPHPADVVIKDQIQYSLPQNWKENVNSDSIVLTSDDWNENDAENLFTSQNGLKVTITRQPGGMFTSEKGLFDSYKKAGDQNSEQEHDAKETTIGGYSGFSTLFTADTYIRRYRVWQGDTIWTFIVEGTDKTHETDLTSLLSSVKFTGK